MKLGFCWLTNSPVLGSAANENSAWHAVTMADNKASNQNINLKEEQKKVIQFQNAFALDLNLVLCQTMSSRVR